MRPVHWVKNGFIFAPLLLAREITFASFANALEAFFVFCLAASSVYVWNDLVDRKEDREHADKQHRPIASGAIPVRTAVGLAAVLSVLALIAAWLLGLPFFLTIAGYFALNGAYSTVLKHIVLIDVFAVAANYVLRIIGGTVVIHERITPWTIILGTLLALFLALGKRRSELVALGDRAHAHRATLAAYTPYVVDQMSTIITATILMTWILYTLNEGISARLHTPWMPITIPFVVYGMFRYLYLVHRKQEGESPTHTLLTDLPLLITVILWCTSILLLRFL